MERHAFSLSEIFFPGGILYHTQSLYVTSTAAVRGMVVAQYSQKLCTPWSDSKKGRAKKDYFGSACATVPAFLQPVKMKSIPM